MKVTILSVLVALAAVGSEGASYDYIVVGAGSAGCIIATRLAEDDSLRVLLLEAGGDTPPESELTGEFPKMVRTSYDWNLTSVPDPRVAQYTVNKALELTSGKMLGGSSSLHHVLQVIGNPADYDNWADIAQDESWNFKNILPYLKKSENMLVPEILDSESSVYHGTDGYIDLTKQPDAVNKKYLEAFAEIGYKTVVDNNELNPLGYTEPTMEISEAGIRQSGPESYLKKVINKDNIDVLTNTEVIRIIFDDNKNAKGVVAVNETGEFEVYSTKEVIVTAGTLNTPKLLMLSGIGPKEHLEQHEIEVISDLPVGQNLQDHSLVVMLQKVGSSNKAIQQRDPHLFPSPIFIGFGALNKSQDIPDYLAISLVIENDSDTASQLATVLFNFNDDIRKEFADASAGNEMLLTVLSQLYPRSRGSIELKSKNHADSPLIYMNLLSNEQDLTDVASFLQDFLEVHKSKYFQSVGAELVKLSIGCDQADDTLEFLKCYALRVASTSWHYVGTCSLGSVVDADLKVKGVGKLRVADASVIPKIPSAKMNAPVKAVAEKAADLIKSS